MSSFTLGPLPCRNPENFSRIADKKKSAESAPVVVHQSCEGENNGKCYRIKGPRTPFILEHLEKKYEAKSISKKNSDDEDEEPRPSTSKASGVKREHSASNDQATSSTSSESVEKKRPRSQK